MSRVLVIGCGGVASVAIQKCCQADEVFTELCIASRTKEKCDALKEKLQGTTDTVITTAKVDADNVDELIALIRDYKPDVVFSKGGFVAVPVVLAAGHYHIPVIIHESDMTPGLANKICMRTAKKICCNFPETVKLLPADKAVLTGTPIRRELLNGSRDAGFAFTGLSDDKPILLMMGGSTGSRAVNAGLRSALPQLLKEFHVIHLCGKGNLDSTLAQPGYIQYEYISDELKDLFAISDIVLSRAGANAICELLALKKPNILVPLPAAVSRGDQILNANSFKKQGFSYVLEEEKLNADTLMAAVHEVYNNRDSYKKAMATSNQSNGVDIVIKLIKELS